MELLIEVFANLVEVFEVNSVFGVWVSAMLGAVFASFGGVVIDRLPHQMKWVEDPKQGYSIYAPQSQCNNCQKPLGVVELIPILGWLLVRGKCGKCDARVPALYPLSEAAMALGFAAIYLSLESSADIVLSWTLLWSAVVVSALDLKHHWIPEVISMPLLWVGLILSPFEPDVYQRLYGAALGGTLMIATFWLVGLGRKEDVYSGGDVALAMVGGAWVGLDFLPTYLVMGSLFFAAHCAWERRREREWVPFGPTLFLSLLLTASIAQIS